MALQHGGVSFTEVFHLLCGQIDAYQGNPEMLAQLALDDQFHRHLVMLLRPGIVGRTSLRRPPNSRRLLDPVCDHIRAHLEGPLALGDLKRISGLSRRSLQYVFWQRYGYTPMQWIRLSRPIALSAPVALSWNAFASQAWAGSAAPLAGATGERQLGEVGLGLQASGGLLKLIAAHRVTGGPPTSEPTPATRLHFEPPRVSWRPVGLSQATAVAV